LQRHNPFARSADALLQRHSPFARSADALLQRHNPFARSADALLQRHNPVCSRCEPAVTSLRRVHGPPGTRQDSVATRPRTLRTRHHVTARLQPLRTRCRQVATRLQPPWPCGGRVSSHPRRLGIDRSMVPSRARTCRPRAYLDPALPERPRPFSRRIRLSRRCVTRMPAPGPSWRVASNPATSGGSTLML
jgi:hypothetical protein